MVIPRGNLQITIFFTIDGFLEFFPVIATICYTTFSQLFDQIILLKWQWLN